jgi:hypothetical protein
VRCAEAGNDLAYRFFARGTLRQFRRAQPPTQREFPAAHLAVAFAQFVFVKRHKIKIRLISLTGPRLRLPVFEYIIIFRPFFFLFRCRFNNCQIYQNVINCPSAGIYIEYSAPIVLWLFFRKSSPQIIQRDKNATEIIQNKLSVCNCIIVENVWPNISSPPDFVFPSGMNPSNP